MVILLKKTILIVLFVFPTILFSQGQPYFSENWSREGGEMAVFYKNTTATDSQGNVYVAGSTINQLGNHDILIQKLTPKGNLIWEQSYNGIANMDDMATYPQGYDMYNGHGRLDAGEAVKQIDYPKYYVKHSDINIDPTVTLVQSDMNVQLMQEINGMSAGNYFADLYRYEWNYQNDVLDPSGEEIIDWWPVLAGTYKGVSTNTNITGDSFMDITPFVNINGTTASVNVVTYAWFVKEDYDNQTLINQWISGEAHNHDPSNLKFMYSIHVKNESLLSVGEEKIEPEVILYPNPTNEIIMVDFGHYFVNPKVEIFNLEGRLIEVIEVKSNDTKTTIDVSAFSHGVYLLRVNDKERSITKKFIKQ